ncbi:hypothetical protein [Vibrio sp. B1Z05]|uniref:hypothetical protein n=1 Tax=Vibrio sp. B1Z05 TaxID=2654980 RepID=UPI00128C39DE|nr:hypothetical protein [Vibrio sp. B1Z05]MPW37298.1 hypothetical protein [Vibrio sp. B1Z05]
MGYIWTNFGMISDVAQGEKFIIVTNSQHQFRKMAIYTYKENAVEVHRKAKLLIGKQVKLRTSQNTDKWPPEIWFSDIEEV